MGVPWDAYIFGIFCPGPIGGAGWGSPAVAVVVQGMGEKAGDGRAADSVEGSKGALVLVTLAERKSRLTLVGKPRNKSAGLFAGVLPQGREP